jgi:DNA-directed RNA polymerase subunit RPC12/RpoP
MNYPCQGCGASVEFAPGSTVLRCPYCGFEQQVQGSRREIREHRWENLPVKQVATVATRSYVCQKCGATTQSDALSDHCQFCGSTLVTETAAIDQIVPEAVLPFHVDQRGVREGLQKWIQSRWFAPNQLKKVTDHETLKGTYLPHWTFDARTWTWYQGQRGEYYYVTETYTETVNGQQQTRTREVRKTRWHSVSGQVGRDFDDVLVPATSHVPMAQLDKLAPWPLHEAHPFQQDYLAGFQTLRYDMEPDVGLGEAKNRMRPQIEQDCRGDIGGDEQRVDSMNTNYNDITYKLMLMPVWILAYLYAGKSYQVLVNARTGEVIGERPYSALKIAMAVAGALALVTVLIVLYVLSKH